MIKEKRKMKNDVIKDVKIKFGGTELTEIDGPKI